MRWRGFAASRAAQQKRAVPHHRKVSFIMWLDALLVYRISADSCPAMQLRIVTVLAWACALAPLQADAQTDAGLWRFLDPKPQTLIGLDMQRKLTAASTTPTLE